MYTKKRVNIDIILLLIIILLGAISLISINSAEALASCDTCDGMCKALLAEIVVVGYDHSTGILRSVGISDIYRDIC